MSRRSAVIVGLLLACAVCGLVAMGLALWPRAYVNPPVRPLAERVDPGDAPNVVLVIGCTVRRDQLTPYGGPETTTPFLAELAARGARFEDAIAASSWTKASTVAMITGRHALSVGMVEPTMYRNERALHPDRTTLAEHFVEAGYETLGATGNPNLNIAFGLAQGFDAYRDADGRIVDGKIGGEALVERLLALIDERQAPHRPLYLRAMFVDAHVPRDDLSDREAQIHRDPQVPPQLAEYRGQLRRFDRAVRALHDGLAARGLDDRNTLWVVVADHGEGLYVPRHHRGHGRTLYGSMIRVPWLIHGPGIPAGIEVLGLASLVDLPRTVLALVGADGPDQGEDWSAQVRGELPKTTRSRVFADTWFYETKRSAVWSSTVACQQDFGTSEETIEDVYFEEGCFERSSDPDFTRPGVDPSMLRELEVWRGQRLQEGAATMKSSGVAVSRELSEQLEALGYVE